MNIDRMIGKFLINIGWFKGEPFRLFKVEFVSIDGYCALETIFEIQVAQFICGLYFDNS